MNTRRNETIGCNLVNGRGSRDEHGPGGRYNQLYNDEIETYSEWIAWLEPAFPTSIFFLPFRYIYIYSLPGSGLFRRNYIPLPSSLGQENGKSVEIGSRHLRGETWMLRIFHPALNWKIFFHELDDFFSPIQGIRFYIISLNKISLVREMNSSRSIERERERTESEIFCRSMRVCS